MHLYHVFESEKPLSPRRENVIWRASVPANSPRAAIRTAGELWNKSTAGWFARAATAKEVFRRE